MRLPTPQDFNTLQAIHDLHHYGWARIDGFDARPSLEAGWIVAHDKGFRLTGTGRALLPPGHESTSSAPAPRQVRKIRA